MNKPPTSIECIRFTFNVISLLNREGFLVSTPQEAFYCLDGLLKKQVDSDVNDSIRELDFIAKNKIHNIS